MKTFWTSDLHLGHVNCIKYDGRPFETIEEHDAEIIKRWNSRVKDDDIVYLVGDLAITRSVEKLTNFISKLNGRKFLVKGNHDTRSNKFYLDAGFEKVYDHPIVLKHKFIVSHEPIMSIIENPHCGFYNIYGHVHNHPDFETVTTNSTCVCCNRWDYKPILIPDYDAYAFTFKDPMNSVRTTV